MRNNFALKAILFYVISLICALVITGMTNAAIYWFFAVAGLSELGRMPLFIAGLAAVEVGACVYCVSSISEDVLFSMGEYDESPTETTDEKAT